MDGESVCMHEEPSEHYFSRLPLSLSQPVVFHDTLRGFEVALWSDRGVFSRGHTDPGTEELIEAMDVEGARRILDLGCGYGVIGIVAAKLAPQASVTMTDVNERALQLSKQNIASNGVKNAEVRQGDGFAPVAGETFDVILTNPPIRLGNEALFDLFAQAPGYLTPGGRLYMVAKTKQGAKTLAKDLARHFATVEQVGQGSGYRVYCGVKATT